jgi:pimeloyl-ACP methyl ester carboxylesterase
MVFVHGFTCDSHDWSWQLPFFQVSHRVVALDRRGHGRSGAPEDGYELPSLIADVAALVEHLDCGPVVAVGHSLGGAIVAALAVERPDLVRAVIAVDPGHLVPDDGRVGLAAANQAYQEGDPVAVAQGAFARLSHTAATPPAPATWHIRRVAGMSHQVLRQTIAGLIGGPEPYILLSNSGPYLARPPHPILSFYVDPARTLRLPAPSFPSRRPRRCLSRARATGCTRSGPPRSTASWQPGWPRWNAPAGTSEHLSRGTRPAPVPLTQPLLNR